MREAPEPLNRLGHHSQECVAAAFALGVRPVMFQPSPAMGVPGHPPIRIETLCGIELPDFFLHILQARQGVVNVTNEVTGNNHAFAFDRGLLLDPDGRVYNLETFVANFVTTCMWVTA